MDRCPKCGSVDVSMMHGDLTCRVCHFIGFNVDNDPPIFLPPYDESNQIYAMAPSLWDMPPAVWEPIWERVTGKGIKIAVLDTGYTKHVDGPDAEAEETFVGESVIDHNGHGTHCIGSALGRNGIGCAPEAQLIVGKVLSNGGSGSSSGIAKGIKWAREQGAHIISMSLGGPSSYTPTNVEIDKCWEVGCWVTAAAGNSGYAGRNTVGWPAKYTGCLCTGSYRKDKAISNFSSGGEELDWACPGEEITSFSNTGAGFKIMSGTSMATPKSAGILALIYETLLREGYPIWTNINQARQFFKQNMKDTGAPGFDVRFGYGIPIMEELVPRLLTGFRYT